MHTQPVVVAVAADDRFARPLAVTLKSVLDTWEGGRALDLYVFDMGITGAHRVLITEMVNRPDVTLHWVTSVNERVQTLPTRWAAITKATYARLFIPDVVPEDVDRVLYLDTDIVVRRCIAELYDTPMGNAAVLAVADAGSPFVSSPYGVPFWFRNGRDPGEVNINAGILLMNLEVWRRERVADAALDYLTDGRHHFAQDQEALNAVLAGRIGLLDPRWNQQSEVFEEMYQIELPYEEEVLKALLTDPWIIHYASRFKPWNYRADKHAFHNAWYDTLDTTPFAKWRPNAARHVTFRSRNLLRRVTAHLTSKA